MDPTYLSTAGSAAFSCARQASQRCSKAPPAENVQREKAALNTSRSKSPAAAQA